MVDALIGAVLGFLSGLGIGGGSLLLLWLTLIRNVAREQARLMNLMFYLPCALIACLFRKKQGKLPRQLFFPAAGAAVCGVLLGNFLSGALDTQWLQKAFGILFLLCGLRELLRK